MKAVHKVYEYYSGLPGWAKGIVVVGGLGIAWFGIVRPIMKAVQRHNDLEGARDEQKNVSDDLNILSRKGVNPTYQSSQYDTWANELQDAYSGCNLYSGISTGKIFKLLKNDADWLALNKAFGIRKCKGCLFERNFEGTLSQAIAWDTFPVTRDALNKQLAANGITYRI